MKFSNFLLLKIFSAVFSITLVSSDVILNPIPNVRIEILDQDNELVLNIIRGDESKYFGIIGRGAGLLYNSSSTDNLANINFLNTDINLRILAEADVDNIHITMHWLAPKDHRLEDCFKLDPYQWYGGPQQQYQLFPIQNLTFEQYSYVTKELHNSAVTEPYWLGSDGRLFFVDRKVPLFIDQNNILTNYICFISEVKDPYSTKRTVNEFTYNIVLTKNAKAGHMYAVNHYLGKPSGLPDFRMIEQPIWSTWARYSRPINESIVMDYANEILDNQFNNSQIEIDDLWEICYGSLTVNTATFPNMKELVSNLKSLGYRVTLWIHPFINENCEPWFSEAREKGFLVKNENGNIYTSWWNNNGSIPAYVDFTNPQARFWWIERVLNLQTTYGFDSFKFDAGESSWAPDMPELTGDIFEHPNKIAVDYVKAVAEFGPMIEIRTGWGTQDLPVFIRMIDKDTLWTYDNGLPTVVTTLLQMNLNGYSLVLPDMIGGNGYNEKPSKELFIRWVQANTFMPTMQFSFVPWDYDNETIEICRKYVNLHIEYADEIYEAMRNSVAYGTPVNPPIWWIDPADQDALRVGDEYLLGENVLVAPVLEQGAVTRDVYLPDGLWKYQNRNEIFYTGPGWFDEVSAPLDTVLFFVRVSNENMEEIFQSSSIIIKPRSF